MMNDSRIPIHVDLAEDAERALIDGARDRAPVSGLTHCYYKYPARFSPLFARAAIKAFTAPGDLCMDPHAGGGTTLVEAVALGRPCVGVDISTLSEFVSSVKTAIFSPAELSRLDVWAHGLPDQVNMRRISFEIDDYAGRGYYKHLKHPARWRLRKAIEQCIWSASSLRSQPLVDFGRCVVLRTSQWALDGRAKNVSIGEFRRHLTATASDMLEGAKALAAAVRLNGERPASVQMLNRSAAGIENDGRLEGCKPPRLILTSPPYPGIHVLYHRWQVDGRKEAPLPFMIAGRLDGAGSSYYTMGDRKAPGLSTYFANILSTMSSVAKVADHDTIFVQMVAFSDATWQLPLYLETMKEAGLEELTLRTLSHQGDGRLWRSVPGRRWYSDQRGATPGSQEVVLLHRKVRAIPLSGGLIATSPSA